MYKLTNVLQAALGSLAVPKSRLSRSNSYDILTSTNPLFLPNEESNYNNITSGTSMTMNRKRSTNPKWPGSTNERDHTAYNSSSKGAGKDSKGAESDAKWRQEFYRNHNRIRYYSRFRSGSKSDYYIARLLI